MIKGGYDFSSSITLTQLLVAPSGTPPPPEGSFPSYPWIQISTEYKVLDSGTRPIPRWRRYDKDFLFMADFDDESGEFKTTVSFRFFAL
ncbi:MAG: hypothetical protein ABDH37_01110 [Candidatus Hydrothermales bacterium]